jgi:hypothetical protein
MGEDELASSSTPKRKRARKTVDADASLTTNTSSKSQPSTISKPVDAHISDVANVSLDARTPIKDIDPPSETMDRPSPELLKSPKVQVVIPSKSPKPDLSLTSSKKAKRRKTTSDMPEADSTLDLSVLPQATPEKKKRGRPKKVSKADAPPEPVQEALPEIHHSQNNQADTALQTTEPNVITPATSISSEIHSAEDTQNQPLPSAITPKDPAPPGPTRTPEQSTKPASRSPASKGKATYRVGLSKRARIAPLLRIVKK